MRFENKSSKLLSITKSKAKMYEFGLDEKHHISMPESPSKLLLMTIGVLGDFCSEMQRSEDGNKEIDNLRSELRNSARYFDALIESKQESSYDYYLLLLGSAAYYLADMPGSSKVLTEKIEQRREQLTPSGIEFILEYILNIHSQPKLTILPSHDISYKDFPEYIPIPNLPIFMGMLGYLNRYFSLKKIAIPERFYHPNTLNGVVEGFRNYFKEHGSDRELLISQIITSLAIKRIKNSTRNLLPKYTDIDWENWSQTALKPGFIKEFWPAQKLLGEAGIFRGRSAVVQLPTSAGKTKSAELIIRSSFLAARASVAVIIAPFRSLCREICDSLSSAFTGEDVLINQLSDIPQIDNFDIKLFSQLFEETVDGNISKSVIVSTPEKLVYLLRHNPELAEEISLVIYDEGHQFDTGARGVTYELLLTTLKQKLTLETQHVLISAVLSNAASIGDWLYAGEGEVVDGAECLSTVRSVSFSSWMTSRGQFHYVDPSNTNTEEFFVPRVLESFQLPLKGKERVHKYFPDKSDKTSIAAYLGLKLSQQGPVAVFCGTKVTVAKICKLVVTANERLQDLPLPRESSDESEIQKIANLAGAHLGQDETIVRAIEKGLLPHSSGMPNGLRIAVEYAMEHGLGRCVICTSTLAQGVNLPIKYLVVSGVFQGKNRISTRDFHNLLGRAGRSGKHTEGSIIFTDTELYDKRRSSKRWQWGQMGGLLDPSKSEHCSSSLLNLAQPFLDDPFDIDPIDFVAAPEKYEAQVTNANKHRGVNLQDLLNQIHNRQAYIRSLESFVLANSDEEDLINSDSLTSLFKNTFAYSMANDEEKQNLSRIFDLVATKANQIDLSKRSSYGKALLGIDALDYIEQWASVNFDELSNKTDVIEVLELLWEVINALIPEKGLAKLIGKDADLRTAEMWCSGLPYYDILSQLKQSGVKYRAGTQERILKIDNIIDICDGNLSYDAMLIVGACADILENIFGEPEVTELVRTLQASLKVGLRNNLAISLYNFGFSDRVVATEIQDSLMAYDSTIKVVDHATIRSYQHIIGPVLNKFPSVFSYSYTTYR